MPTESEEPMRCAAWVSRDEIPIAERSLFARRRGGQIEQRCSLPIRKKEDGPCVNACFHDADGHREEGFYDQVTEPENRPSPAVCEWCEIERLLPDETGHLHDYDPGWEHVPTDGVNGTWQFGTQEPHPAQPPTEVAK